MNALKITMTLFIILESLNVLMLYFQPGSQRGNGVGFFNPWEKSKKDPQVHELFKYKHRKE